MKKLVEQWSLPKGDIYEIWQSTSCGASSFYSYVKREQESTLCCHGTNSMATIKQYYLDVKSAQQDIMEDRKNARIHTYWMNYKKRRLLNYTSRDQLCDAHTSLDTLHHSPLPSNQTIVKPLSSKESKTDRKKVSFAC